MNKIVVYRPISMVFGLNAEEFNSQVEDEGEVRIEQDTFPQDWPYLARTYRTFDTQEAADNFIFECESPEESDSSSPNKLYIDFSDKHFELALTEDNCDLEDDDTGLYGYSVPVYQFIREAAPELEQWKAIVLARAVAADDPLDEIVDFYSDSFFSPAWDEDNEEITEYSYECRRPYNEGCPRLKGQADDYRLDTFVGFNVAAGVAQADISNTAEVNFDDLDLDFDFDGYDKRAEITGYFIVPA